MVRARRIMQKVFVILLAGMVMLTAAGAESLDYYSIGLEVTGVLNEMVQSRDYLSLFLQNEEALKLLDTMFNTGDYNAPAAVYRLKQTDPREWMKTLMTEEQQEQFAALSPALQDQVYIRLNGMTVMSNRINAMRGTQVLALSASLQALLTKPGLEAEEPVHYLYVFRKGVPVLVSFGWHQASGTFLALEKTETESEEALKACMAFYGIEVSPVDIP